MDSPLALRVRLGEVGGVIALVQASRFKTMKEEGVSACDSESSGPAM